ncbi:MAG TPA: hypothetical protein VJZ06_04370, partial [Mobilitalea sp.]|nr:hypothetical protein [Mobilitalea sp.]
STATDDQYENTFIDGVTGEWKKVVLEFAIPEDTSKANLYFDKKYTETDLTLPTFFLDNVLIYEGTIGQAEAAYAKLYPTVTITTLTDASSPTYGLTILASAVSGSALTVDTVTNVVAVSGGAIVAGGDGESWKVANISIGAEYVGKTVTLSAKMKRSTEGSLAWQTNEKDYPAIDPKWEAAADTWYTVSGTLTIGAACELFLSPGPDTANTMYYIADVVITVK